MIFIFLFVLLKVATTIKVFCCILWTYFNCKVQKDFFSFFSDVQMRSASARLRTLTSGDSEKISEFFQNLDVAGSKLEELSRIRLSRMIGQTKKLLEEIAVEQEFTVVFVRLNEKTESGLVQSQVQISTMPVFVGLGAGRNRGSIFE